ncbi:DUF1727 domain-containing protein [Schaalia sp. ZJ405]|uniref:Mur ligase family protein n=1 Tax=Schaalia sp. ZJ405 TaxID=2709403 RepID=UPI0018CA4E92|nr:MurT ligase domain-containing protein [Schaalia sp. ZJ405]QPK81066.1 DUF1727 domain-containing protein [Schaalia sp. ZJ405]
MTEAQLTPPGNAPARRRAALPFRSRVAVSGGRLARWASRTLGRGSGGMIGGQIALRLSPDVLADLGTHVSSVIVSGTNGKSTTTRMVSHALATAGTVTSNTNGDNMTAGIVSALIASPSARFASLEVDEMHVPSVAAQAKPSAIVLLNVSRDQLDRVGEIGAVEQRLRQAVNDSPHAVVVANCDDPLVVSAACDSPNVQWVSAGSGWTHDAAAYPRGGRVIYDEDGWHLVASKPDETLPELSRRPQPHWWLSDVSVDISGSRARLHGPGGIDVAVNLRLPGRANLGNAAQAVAAAVALGVPAEVAAKAVAEVTEVAGRYSTHDISGRKARLILAKNPAGWQETLSMIDPLARQIVIGVNGQVPDGQDLSWLWDVEFSLLGSVPPISGNEDEAGAQRRIIACGERGADLAVRLEYAGIKCELVSTPMEAIERMDAGPVEVLVNYTALRDFTALLHARGYAESTSQGTRTRHE